jgi:hypothetical protein
MEEAKKELKDKWFVAKEDQTRAPGGRGKW